MQRIAPCAALSLALCACSELPDQVEITEQRTLAPNHRENIPDVDTRTRLGFRSSATKSDESSGPRTFGWDTPEGWESLQPAQFREINLRVKAHPEAQCYLTRLGGDGGGLAGNVNRWRSQMGLSPLGASELAELPTITLLGKPAPFVSLDGKYVGMGRESKSDEWRMYAALLSGPMFTITVKMTGPKSVLEAERQNFERFVSSIHFRSMSQPASGGAKPVPPSTGTAPTTQPAAGGGAKTPANIRWNAPKHWQSGRTSSMRLATFHPGGGKDIELSLITLPGTAGGLVPNVQRWYGQMQAEEPSESAVLALPKVDVLGAKGTLLEVAGSYQGMGSQGTPGSMMLGVIAQPTEAFSVYIKLTGPETKVRAEKENFLAFCKSLRFE